MSREALNEEQFACPNCGQSHSYDEDNRVFGSQGCAQCGRTRPYLARPTKEGTIATGTKRGGSPSWMDPKYTLVRKEGNVHKALALEGPSTGQYIHCEGRTAQGAINDVMGQMAKKQGAKWWPTTSAWHNEVDKRNREIEGW